MKRSQLIGFIFSLSFFLFFQTEITSCRRGGVVYNGVFIADTTIQKGKTLANIYCASCHLFPDPALLTKKVWLEGILPQMGPRLGIFDHNHVDYPNSKSDTELDKNYYPSEPLITHDEWESILQYYVASAPDTLFAPKREALVDDGDKFFQILTPKFLPPVPVTCMVKIDTSEKKHRIVIGGVFQKKIFVYDEKLVLIDSVDAGGIITDLSIEKNQWMVCDIGIMNPNNGMHGRMRQIKISGNKFIVVKKSVIDSLRRPVQIHAADLNGDGKTDYVVCEFGNLTGALSWLENKGDDKFVRHVLREQPGPLTVFVNDYNHDGLPDIWVLFAQGNEMISLFINKGKGEFEQQDLLRFPSCNGSSSFDLVDMNHDGFLDIVYTAGDNADYSKILKPFHGVYIFMNNGKNEFKQEFFYPINGAFKVCARDFDGDGDIDLAVISFFADYVNTPNEGFIYLENMGANKFKPHSLSTTNAGRWLTMDADDVDGDGKPDIVLGNFSVAPTNSKPKINFKAGPPFMFLKNISRK